MDNSRREMGMHIPPQTELGVVAQTPQMSQGLVNRRDIATVSGAPITGTQPEMVNLTGTPMVSVQPELSTHGAAPVVDGQSAAHLLAGSYRPLTLEHTESAEEPGVQDVPAYQSNNEVKQLARAMTAAVLETEKALTQASIKSRISPGTSSTVEKVGAVKQAASDAAPQWEKQRTAAQSAQSTQSVQPTRQNGSAQTGEAPSQQAARVRAARTAQFGQQPARVGATDGTQTVSTSGVQSPVGTQAGITMLSRGPMGNARPEMSTHGAAPVVDGQSAVHLLAGSYRPLSLEHTELAEELVRQVAPAQQSSANNNEVKQLAKAMTAAVLETEKALATEKSRLSSEGPSHRTGGVTQRQTAPTPFTASGAAVPLATRKAQGVLRGLEDLTVLKADNVREGETWGTGAQVPVELAHMEPSLGGDPAQPRETPRQQEQLLKQLQRSMAETGGAGGTQAPRMGGRTLASHAKGAMAGRDRNIATLTGLPRKGGAAALEEMSAYPVLSMEYGGPLVAMAKELRQTAARELGKTGIAREMGVQSAAAKAMEEKGSPESMQTLELVTKPQLQEQVVWQNPYMRSGPTEITHHQKNAQKNAQQQQRQQPQTRMSDAEIRRTADKVFKLVQEKIIAERRRIGRY